MLIYKVLRADERAAFDAAGETLGAPVDRTDGYIHLSTAAQLGETLKRYFAGERGIVLLGVDADAAAADLVWEPSRGGALFPHLYRPLRRADIVEVVPLADGPDGPLMPAGLA